jgi:hypothetical protein
MLKTVYQAESDRACVVSVLGEFKPGESKDISDADVHLFELINGYKLGASNFAPWFHLTVKLVDEPESTKGEEG